MGSPEQLRPIAVPLVEQELFSSIQPHTFTPEGRALLDVFLRNASTAIRGEGRELGLEGTQYDDLKSQWEKMIIDRTERRTQDYIRQKEEAGETVIFQQFPTMPGVINTWGEGHTVRFKVEDRDTGKSFYTEGVLVDVFVQMTEEQQRAFKTGKPISQEQPVAKQPVVLFQESMAAGA